MRTQKADILALNMAVGTIVKNTKYTNMVKNY
jgi:hypothetical protein